MEPGVGGKFATATDFSVESIDGSDFSVHLDFRVRGGEAILPIKTLEL